MDIGIDLVHIPRIADLMSDTNACKKIFHPSEFTDDVETLAGIFAAKEAYFKAKGEKKDWLDVTVQHEESGKPVMNTQHEEEVSVSITHEKDSAAAVVLLE